MLRSYSSVRASRLAKVRPHSRLRWFSDKPKTDTENRLAQLLQTLDKSAAPPPPKLTVDPPRRKDVDSSQQSTFESSSSAAISDGDKLPEFSFDFDTASHTGDPKQLAMKMETFDDAAKVFDFAQMSTEQWNKDLDQMRFDDRGTPVNKRGLSQSSSSSMASAAGPSAVADLSNLRRHHPSDESTQSDPDRMAAEMRDERKSEKPRKFTDFSTMSEGGLFGDMIEDEDKQSKHPLEGGSGMSKVEEAQRLLRKQLSEAVLSETEVRECVAELDASEKSLSKEEFYPSSLKFDNPIEQWIYDQIRECHGEMLPLPEEISAEFSAEISPSEAKRYRELVLQRLLRELPSANRDDGGTGLDRSQEISLDGGRFDLHWPPKNHFSRVGSHYASLNPFETRASADPLDSVSHPTWKFNGSEHFDPAWQRYGVNTMGLDPRTAEGLDNKVWDTVEDAGRLIQRVDSDHGRFSYLLSNNSRILRKSTTGVFEMMRRELEDINDDSTTVCCGITGRNRKELIPDLDWESLSDAYECGLPEMASQTLNSVFGLSCDLVTMCKPTITATHGILDSSSQMSVLINSSARLCDPGTKFVFNDVKYGSVPFGGLLYRSKLCPKPLNSSLLYHLISGELMNAYDALEMGLIDWIIPPNSVALFQRLGREMDLLFQSDFANQDRFKRRAMIKNLIELFDLGLDRFRGPSSEESFQRDMRSLFHYPHSDSADTYESSNLLNHMQDSSNALRAGSVQKDTVHKFDIVQFHMFLHNLKEASEGRRRIPYQSEQECKSSVRRARRLQKRLLNDCCPLALRMTYDSHRLVMNHSHNLSLLFPESYSDASSPFSGSPLSSSSKTSSGSQSRLLTDFERLMRVEWNCLHWLMHNGDFFNGAIKRVYGDNEGANWQHRSLDFVGEESTDPRVREFSNPTDHRLFQNSQFFAEPPSDVTSEWDESLKRRSEFKQIVPPMHSTLNVSGQWEGGITGDEWFRNCVSEDRGLHDFTMLRGGLPPFLDDRLRSQYGYNWRLLRVYQGRTRTASPLIRQTLGFAS